MGRAYQDAEAGPDCRHVAYSQVMKVVGLAEEFIWTPSSRRETVRQVVRDYIARNGPPDALFCLNDERAIASLAALRDLGLRVPEDVQLIGCDGIEETVYHHPALSTIQYPFDEATRLSWQFLSRRIQEPDAPPQRATLTARLVIRESSVS